MKIINLFFIFFLFTGCLTVNRIERNCDKFAQICLTDNQTEIVYRDTTIYVDRIVTVQLPKDTVRITDTIRIINNRAYLPTRYERFGIIGVNAGVNNSVLKVEAMLLDSTILLPVHDTVLIENAVQQTSTTNTVVLPPEKFIPKFYKFTFWVFIILAVAGIGFGYMKFKNIFFNIFKK